MMQYTQQDVLVLGKRHHNTKRQYLLIDPLQAKHIPVSPGKALQMMQTLSQKLRETYPATDCIIGFAETATAIAAAAASEFPKDVLYLQTTREPVSSSASLHFLEEHSHAVDQTLCTELLQEHAPEHVLLIDDEISTGKTVANIIEVLRKKCLPESRFSVGSVLNRMTPELQAAFRQDGFDFTSLVPVEQQDFEALVRDIVIQSPASVPRRYGRDWQIFDGKLHTDPRKGITVGQYRQDLEKFVQDAMRMLQLLAPVRGRVLVLGTEECMYPALLLGKALEEAYPKAEIFCHATTRSPIGISRAKGYPIRSGYHVQSFYEPDRENYLYQIGKYDTVLVVTDSQNDAQIQYAMNDIVSLFYGAKQIFCLQGRYL